MINQNLLPISNFDEVPQIKYLEGFPRQYRFDASRGIFNIKGITPLTRKGETLTIIPVAYRIFKDNILGMGVKSWAEFFFLNASNQMCAILLHGYSVQNLMRVADEMFYDDVKFTDVELSITPVEKTNKREKSKYFIAEFSYKILDKKVTDTLNEAIKELDIYRIETHTGDADIKFLHNYKVPQLQSA